MGIGVFLWKGGYIGRWIRGYKKLPELRHTLEAKKERLSQFMETPPREYGIDKNNNGKIEEKEVIHTLWVPDGWNVENNTGAPSLSTDKVIFRFYGNNGIWGTVIEADISNLSNKSSKDFMRYYTNKRASMANLLEGISPDQYETKIHKKRKTKVTYYECETPHYEVYATEKFPRGKFASIAIYVSVSDCLNEDIGFVVKTYIPPNQLNQHTRELAYSIGTDFKYHGR